MDDSRFNQETGARIREARKARKITQQEMAERAGLSLPHYSEIERGNVGMKLETFRKIIEVLQISSDSILRPDIPQVKQMDQEETASLLGDCSPAEREFVKQVIVQMKLAFHRQQETE